MTASLMCIGAERRGVPYADAQYWGRYRRYGRCIVKGYQIVNSAVTLQNAVATFTASRKHSPTTIFYGE